MIGAAIAAGAPVANAFPARRAVKSASVDLRTLDRHPGAAISSLIPSSVVPPVLAQRAVREAGNVDGGAYGAPDLDPLYHCPPNPIEFLWDSI